MIKVAEFINGKIICGTVEDTAVFHNDTTWNHVLFVQLIVDADGNKKGVKFTPVVRFGDFEQPIEIKEENLIYMYNASPKFIQSYRQNVTDIKKLIKKLEEQKSKSDIAIASPADVPKGRFKPI